MLYSHKINTTDLDQIEPLVVAVDHWERTHYDHGETGDYSATALINPPRVTLLKKRHPKDRVVQTSSKMPAFFGSSIHKVYEDSLEGVPGYQLENRMKAVVLDRVITGKFDILKDRKDVYDIKTTKTWKIVFDPILKDWHEQQNIYAFLLSANGYHIESINAIAHYLDWSKGVALRGGGYPQSSVVEYNLSLWDNKTTAEFVESRVELFKSCENLADNDLPECTPEERWERFPNGGGVQYAIFKNNGSKRAARVLNSIQEITDYGKSNTGFGSDSFIEVRYPERKRCAEYCDVSHHCNVYQDYKRREQSGSLNDYIPLYT